MSGALRIAVIGGGFTGAVFVMHAVKASTGPLDITVIEPHAEVGRGVAYGTDDPQHLLNVPTDRMPLFKDDPTQATRWFFAHGYLPNEASDDGQGQFYISRQAYGAFVMDILDGTIKAAGDRVTFRHAHCAATRIMRQGGGWRVTTAEGETIDADLVALCLGHAAPAAPCAVDAGVMSSAKLVPNPWASKALAAVRRDDSVLVVGTGLTMADVVMSLHERGHAGRITAISRRGLLPHEHGMFRTDLDIFEGGPPPATALGLLRCLRRQVRKAGAELGWQPVIDSLRARLPIAWNALPADQQRLVLRRLLPFWEVHRFRIAPQVKAVLTRLRAAGQLVITKAALQGLAYRDGGYAARLRPPRGEAEMRDFDAVVFCTGPNKTIADNPLVAGLLTEGDARLDNVAQGLAVDQNSRVIGANGAPTPGLLAFGPITRGSFGEMTGAPDIARQVEAVTAGLFVDAN